MDKAIENSLAFEGWTNELSLAVMQTICQELYKNNHKLNTLEIGYFKGRTTNLVLESGSTFHTVIDPFVSLNEKHVKYVNFIKHHSRYAEPYLQNLIGRTDYIFIDGGHEKGDLWNDLDLANKLLTENGILIVDDIDYSGAPGYPHLIKTLDDYCNITGCFIKICLIDHKQMILCRPEKFIDYYYFLFFKVPKIIGSLCDKLIVVRPFDKTSFQILIGWEKDFPVKYQPYGDDNNFYLPLRIDSDELNQNIDKYKNIFNIQ